MSLALTTLLAVVVGGVTPAEAPSYAMAPLSRAAPPLQRAYDALERSAASTKELTSAKSDLARWTKTYRGPDDTLRIAWWLEGMLSLRLGDVAAARYQRDRLAIDNSTLADPLRSQIARHRTAILADKLAQIEVCARTLSFQVDCGRPIRALVAEGHSDRIIAPLEGVLAGPMHRTRRNAVTALFQVALVASGQAQRAKRRELAMWWRTGLRDNAPSEEAWWARRVLLMGNVRNLQKRLKEAPISRELKTVLSGAVMSRSKRHRRRAYDTVSPTHQAAAFQGEHAMFAWFALAQIRRRVDADLAAVDAYRKVFEQAPRHPLADIARREAAWLSLRRGLPSDARKWFLELAESSTWGAPNRDGLWYDGLNAFTDGKYGQALKRFETLGVRYGGQREAYRLSWGARAAYWKARSLQELGRFMEASTDFSALATAFPTTWYGMMARQHRQAMATRGQIAPFADRGIALAARRVKGLGITARTKVVCRPELDLAMALRRLGDTDKSAKAFEAIRRMGRLRDTARALLADFRAASGALSAAKRLLVSDGAWARKPSRKERAIYRDAFPFRYRRAIKRLARRGGYPPGLLAGLVYVESRFNPKARSNAGATGLTQLMYGTAKAVSKKLLRRRLRKRDLYRSRTNLKIGSRFVQELYEHFGRNPALAAAAYNAGHGAVRGWLKRRGHLPTDLFVEWIPYDQARNYVRRVVGSSELYRQLYGLTGGALKVPFELPLVLGPFFEESAKR